MEHTSAIKDMLQGQRQKRPLQVRTVIAKGSFSVDSNGIIIYGLKAKQSLLMGVPFFLHSK